jgi:hypothetical protein
MSTTRRGFIKSVGIGIAMAALPLPVAALKNPEEAIQHVEKYVPALCAYLNIWYVDIGDKQFQYTCLIEEPLDSLTQAHKNFYIEDMKYFFRKTYGGTA